ncbi:hypothetical protein WH52_11950 [Tenacibaculum holothuriorum]|uniref:Beta-lactamase n=1 Tax=Tenacibaculum holothuriorum TaxID=1635173 RepID=A0A1Y2PA77_9FLAO|nr:serine hydrolase [Tenacibaculum holothuriorum]OSY87353.1 hypothetical protein WH52_11950 [Tenacibaculum holothuriorum]
MKKKSFLALLFVFVLKVNSQQKGIYNNLKGLDTEIESLMKAYKTVGLTVSIAKNHKVIYAKSFGYSDLKNKVKVNANTLFPIGSVTKQFTSALIGIYQGKGKLSVYDKPKKHISYLQFNSNEMNNLITIEDLLAHRSGIGNVDGTHVFFPTKSIKAHIQRVQYLTPNSQVREKFDYSNMGYAILGAIGETITGKKWEKNLSDEIFKPLEMNRSNTNLRDLENARNVSLGYSVNRKGKIVKVLYENQFESIASGAINSTLNDMTNWMLMLLNKGKYKGTQIIPEKFLEESFSEHNIIQGSFSFKKKYNLLNDAYGYGWFTHNYKNLYRVNHEGNVSGFTSSITLYPYKELGIVILTNQGSANLLTKAITDIITNRILNLKRKRWDEYTVNYGIESDVFSERTTLKRNQSYSKYVGKYTNKGYGTLEITESSDNKLQVIFPALKMGLKSEKNDVFNSYRIVETHQNTPSFNFKFIESDKGKILELVINFQQEPVIFKKEQ